MSLNGTSTTSATGVISGFAAVSTSTTVVPNEPSTASSFTFVSETPFSTSTSSTNQFSVIPNSTIFTSTIVPNISTATLSKSEVTSTLSDFSRLDLTLNTNLDAINGTSDSITDTPSFVQSSSNIDVTTILITTDTVTPPSHFITSLSQLSNETISSAVSVTDNTFEAEITEIGYTTRELIPKTEPYARFETLSSATPSVIQLETLSPIIRSFNFSTLVPFSSQLSTTDGMNQVSTILSQQFETSSLLTLPNNNQATSTSLNLLQPVFTTSSSQGLTYQETSTIDEQMQGNLTSLPTAGVNKIWHRINLLMQQLGMRNATPPIQNLDSSISTVSQLEYIAPQSYSANEDGELTTAMSNNLIFSTTLNTNQKSDTDPQIFSTTHSFEEAQITMQEPVEEGFSTEASLSATIKVINNFNKTDSVHRIYDTTTKNNISLSLLQTVTLISPFTNKIEAESIPASSSEPLFNLATENGFEYSTALSFENRTANTKNIFNDQIASSLQSTLPTDDDKVLSSLSEQSTYYSHNILQTISSIFSLIPALVVSTPSIHLSELPFSPVTSVTTLNGSGETTPVEEINNISLPSERSLSTVFISDSTIALLLSSSKGMIESITKDESLRNGTVAFTAKSSNKFAEITLSDTTTTFKGNQIAQFLIHHLNHLNIIILIILLQMQHIH